MFNKSNIVAIVLVSMLGLGIAAGSGFAIGHDRGVASVPTATVTPTSTPTATPTETATPTSTFTPVPTNTRMPTNTPVATNTPVPTNTRVATQTPLPTVTPGPDPDAMFLEGVDAACQYANSIVKKVTGMMVANCNKLTDQAERDKWRINPMRGTATPVPTLETTPGLSAPGLRQQPSTQGDGA